MKIELVKWDLEHKAELCRLCNGVDRSYLSDRIPYPYQDGDAEWWIGMTLEQEGKGGIFRAILVDGAYAGTISVEQKEDVYCRDGEIGYTGAGEKRLCAGGKDAAGRVEGSAGV